MTNDNRELRARPVWSLLREHIVSFSANLADLETQDCSKRMKTAAVSALYSHQFSNCFRQNTCYGDIATQWSFTYLKEELGYCYRNGQLFCLK